MQSRGSELIIRHGKPEVELPKILKEISGTALYCHQEVQMCRTKVISFAAFIMWQSF
jgi:deoxyribodipyrimidine photolyase